MSPRQQTLAKLNLLGWGQILSVEQPKCKIIPSLEKN
jgi:hypothetical protein